jgi:putative transposase
MRAIDELLPQISTAAACRSLGVPRATLYRRRRPKPSAPPTTPRRKPPRALDDHERQQVLDVLHSEPFADKPPAEVYAALLDQGQYLCSIRTMYRILDERQEVRERSWWPRRPIRSGPGTSPSC